MSLKSISDEWFEVISCLAFLLQNRVLILVKVTIA